MGPLTFDMTKGDEDKRRADMKRCDLRGMVRIRYAIMKEGDGDEEGLLLAEL
jgi:hypothetical protein